MASFAYVARDRSGKKQSGTMQAESRQALAQMLQSRGLTPEKIEAKGGAKRGGGKRVKTVELLVFTRQLATIVNAGLPLLQGLDILAEQTEDENFATIIAQIGQNVEAGETFSESLRQHPRAFPELYTSMVRAGEASGDLDGVLEQLANYLESSEELKRRIKSAMTYPVVAFGIIVLIAGGLLTFVVPQFKKIFDEMGAELPAITKLLIQMSDIIMSWRILIAIGILVAIFIGTRMYGQTSQGRYNLDALKLRLPIFGKLLRKVAISRFTRTLSTLTKSGVAILQAMEIVERTAGNEVFAKAIRESADSVRNGETLADPLARSEQFPTMVTRMIGIGEKTGALETMLGKIADFYDSEVKSTVETLTSLLEPILIVCMGTVVGFMVIALFMPIMNLSEAVRQ